MTEHNQKWKRQLVATVIADPKNELSVIDKYLLIPS